MHHGNVTSRRREEERQARLQRAREYEDAAWVQPGAEDGAVEAEEGGGEALDVADELYCMACDKFFKSANAMANHERCALAALLLGTCCPLVPAPALLLVHAAH